VGNYLSQLDDEVILLHIGPNRVDFGPNCRAIWLPSLPPERFVAIVNAVDLFLSVNISATSISQCLVHEIPVLALYHGHPPSDNVNKIGLPEAPQALYPFYVWPLGFYDFLGRVVADGPFIEAISIVEITDQEKVLQTIERLLFSTEARQQAIDQQNAYVNQVKQLPDAAQLFANI
jgi:hypothetical protein